MSYLSAAIIGVGVLSLVNLWLTVAIARKLHDQSQQLVRRVPPPMLRKVVGLPPGTPVPEFSMVTVAGTAVSAADLRGERSLIGFFMPGCAPCHDQVPAFMDYARNFPGGPGRVLAAVATGGRVAAKMLESDADRLVEELSDASVAHVVVGSSAKIAATSLAVTGYPSFILLSADGRVEVGTHGVSDLDTSAPTSSAGHSGR